MGTAHEILVKIMLALASIPAEIGTRDSVEMALVGVAKEFGCDSTYDGRVRIDSLRREKYQSGSGQSP